MENPKAWEKIILRGDEKRLRRINGRLFRDQEETIVYLTALRDAAKKAQSTKKTNPLTISRIQELLKAVRQTFLTIGTGKVIQFLERLTDRWESLKDVTVMLFGSRRTDGNAVESFELLLSLFARYIGSSDDIGGICMVLLHRLIGATGATCTWESAVRDMYRTGDLTNLHLLVEAFASTAETEFIPVPQSTWVADGSAWSPPSSGSAKLHLPVPDKLMPWFKTALSTALTIIARANRQIQVLLDKLRADFLKYRAAYENMWLEMMIQPRHALRPDGLDCASVEIAELAGFGYRNAYFFPEPDFPDFRVRFVYTRFGWSRLIEARLEPSDLSLVNFGGMPESDSRVWMDRLLAFIAVRSVWQIVMGAQKSIGAGGSGGGGDASVRPHLRRLPPGYKMSPEARARALAIFRTTPLPGFTFVTGYIRGENPASGEPLFAVTAKDLPV